MNAALWCRVSTAEQDPGNQLAALRAEAQRRGWYVAKEYQVHESAYRGQRDGLAQLLADAQRHRFSVVLVWALDRLSRGGPLEVLQFVHRLGACQVQVVSLQEPWIEASGELRDLLLSLAGWVARFESARKGERVKAAMDRLKARGVAVGRPHAQVDLDYVAQCRQQGIGWATIAKRHPASVPTPRGGWKRPGVTTIRRAWERMGP